MEINIVIGTKGQLIKMAPIMMLLKKNGVEFNFINAAQHGAIFNEIIDAFQIPHPSITLIERERDVLHTLEEMIWFGKAISHSLFLRKKLFSNSILVVHGDAPPAFLGLVIGKLTHSKIAHVEAGLRSYNFFDPFPEEIIRFSVGKHAEYLYAPSEKAAQNLKQMNVRGKIVNTQENTVLDSVRYSIRDYNFCVPDKIRNSVIFTIHRFETLKSKKKMASIISILKKINTHHNVTFVMHNTTHNYLQKYNILSKIPQNVNIVPLQVYPEFIKMIHECQFVVTDSGGLQEETTYLGKPCLILRRLSEREHGLSETAVISKFDENIIDDFIKNFENYERKDMLNSDVKPSEAILEHIKNVQEEMVD